MITNGEITQDQIQQQAVTYLTENTHNSQNSEQLFHCMSNSLTPDAYAKVVKKDMQYLVAVSDMIIADSPCFLKAVIDVAYTNTRSSSVVIRAMLASLNDYMKTLKDSNIETFNQHVKDNLKKLVAAGESSNDLLMNLFKAYQCTKDKQFVAWVNISRD